MSMPLLAGRALGKRYRIRGRTVVALRGVSLVLRAGASVGLVGESGSGKSTLGRILTGLESPTTGQVSFQGRDLGALDRQQRRDFRRRVQYVFQDPLGALNPRKRVRDSLGAPLRDLLALRSADRECRAGELLEAVGLTRDFLLRYPHELSGGQAQRVAIARALAPGPDVLVLDEPVSALDVSVQAQILERLRTLRRELGLALLFISHDLAVVEQVCDEVAVLYRGELVEQGNRRRVLREPEHVYTRTLLRAIPVPGRGLSLPLPGSAENGTG
jgi:ABC-type glutathione transport system ATPase component